MERKSGPGDQLRIYRYDVRSEEVERLGKSQQRIRRDGIQLVIVESCGQIGVVFFHQPVIKCRGRDRVFAGQRQRLSEGDPLLLEQSQAV